MTSKQYEELCRLFLADQLQIPIDQVLTLDVMGSRRPGSPEYHHQIDLYWETADAVARHVHIANAKWRTPPGKLDQEDVLLIQKIRDKVGAHKAVLITNFGFTEGARAAAHDEGVALHLVGPRFAPGALVDGDRTAIRQQLADWARISAGRPLYVHEMIRKSLGSTGLPAGSSSGGSAAVPAMPPGYLIKAPLPGGGLLPCSGGRGGALPGSGGRGGSPGRLGGSFPLLKK
jgi:hypothetical protein